MGVGPTKSKMPWPSQSTMKRDASNKTNDQGETESNNNNYVDDDCFYGPILGERYVLGRKINSGGTGVVYIGWDSLQRKRVAIKKIGKRAYLERERESQLARDPHMLNIRKHSLLVCPQDVIEIASSKRDCFGDSGNTKLYIIMDLLGPDFRVTIQERKGITLPDFAQGLSDLLEALHFLHSLGMIHRDIKPENCFWTSDRRLKLGDFGLTRKINIDYMTAQMVTRWYRSPELLMGTTNYNESVDVFAAGVMAVEMLTGQPLAPGDTEISQLSMFYEIIIGNNCKNSTQILDCSRNFLNKRHLRKNQYCSDEIELECCYQEAGAPAIEPTHERGNRISEIILKAKPDIFYQTRHQLMPRHQYLMNHISVQLINLLSKLISWDPRNRLDAYSAKNHRFFELAREVGWLQ